MKQTIAQRYRSPEGLEEVKGHDQPFALRRGGQTWLTEEDTSGL